jgi:integrase
MFNMMLSNNLPSVGCRDLVQRFNADLSKEVGSGYRPISNVPWLEMSDQEDFARERIEQLEREMLGDDFAADKRATAFQLIEEAGMDVQSVSGATLQNLLHGITRAMIEQQKRFIFRLHERVLPYPSNDPLFDDTAEQDRPASRFSAANADAIVTADQIGITVAELIAEYLKSKRREWTPKTYQTHAAKLDLLSSHLGGERRIASVTAQDLWAFAEGLLRLRRNYHTGVSSSFLSRQTASEGGRITATTAENILARTKSLFRWANERQYSPTNPAAIVRITQPKKQKGKRSRRPFTPDETIKLFTAPLFTGCLSAARRFDPGPNVFKDAYFWLPILGYYTGARLGELIQLHFDDLHTDDAIPHISINEGQPDATDLGDHKHVKSDAGVRLIPLHPDLLALGFADFVRLRRKAKAKRQRLFWDVKYGADGQPSTVMSKWFGRALDKVGLSDPTLVFHSFRHGIEDAFRNALTPQYIIDKIVGHADDAVSFEYGEGVSLEIARDAITGAKFPVRLPSLWEASHD